MLLIGLIRERKALPDERVAFTPAQCDKIQWINPDIKFIVEPSPLRCFTDDEYRDKGIKVDSDLSDCDVLLGIKEVPVDYLISDKKYFFFSHTKKKQPHNQKLMHALIEKHICMIDYECLTHRDEQRILGFGFYAGIVGAHNGLLTYGKKFGAFHLPPAHTIKDYKQLVAAYDRINIPNIKIAVTGSGKVASGVIDLLTQLDIEPVEPFDFLTHQYDYPVYTLLKGGNLYQRKDNDTFQRDDFHVHPEVYKCLFGSYINQVDILMNGIYWDHKIPPLFNQDDIKRYDWRISVISDITCDINGSVPINIGATTIADPVYGIDRETMETVSPYQNTKDIIDIMAVDNLPNELPRDASQYFGVHFEKYILPELLEEHSDTLQRATICDNGRLTKKYEYLSDYAYS